MSNTFHQEAAPRSTYNWKLEKLKEENQALGSELAEMKSKDGCTVGDDAIVGSIPTDQGGTL